MARIVNELPLDRRSCQLLGPTALIVQALMGVLAVLSLVYKRQCEPQKRPWKIWLFDVSKQVAGQMFVHGLNVLISNLGSHHSAGNACTYYFLNILIDTTLGVGLIYLVLQCATWLLSNKLRIKGLKTGQYGSPPSVTYWARQAAVYVFSITTMKFLVVALFAVWPGISSIGDWLLSWTIIGDGESVQVIFVMGVFPIIMNVVQFWLIDSIVKASTTSAAVSDSPRNSGSEDREPLFNSAAADEDSPQDIENGPPPSASRTTSEGDFKTLFGSEDDKMTPSASGSSSPMNLVKSAVVAAHDYPPNSVSSQGSLSSRSRHQYRPSLLDLPIAYSAPAMKALDSTRNTSRPNLPSKTFDAVAELDAWDKDDWQEQTGDDGWTGLLSEHKTIRPSTR